MCSQNSLLPGSIFSGALEWKAQGYLPFGENLVQIPAGLAHALWALTHTKKDTGCNNVGYAPGPDGVDEPGAITPGRRAQVSLESLSITVLLVAPRRAASSNLLPCLGFKTELLFWDPSYINMQPHIPQTCVRHTQTHAQIILDVYTERLELRSDKAYLIREHSSFNQV